jgi:hypothetical protein
MEQNRYARYGLKQNPFPEVAIASKDEPGPFVIFDEKFMKRLIFLIESSLSQKAWGGIPLVGKVGSGKSRLLFEIYKRYKESKQVKLILIDNPGLSLKNFYSVILEEALKDPNLVPFLFHRYRENLLEIVTQHGHKTLMYPSALAFDLEKREVIYDALASLMHEEEVFLDESLGRCFAIAITYEIVTKKDYFKDEVSFVGSTEGIFQDHSLALEFLKGGRLPRTVSVRLKCPTQEMEERTIVNFGIKSLCRLFRLMGYGMIFLLVDQFERIIEQLPTRTMLSLLDGYRSLVDKNLENFSAVFACTTESWFESVKAYPSFKDRFTDPLEIPKVTAETARRIVIAFCDPSRISRQYKNSIFPFSEGSISYILEKSDTIRDFLENCHLVLLQASIKLLPKIEDANITGFL